MNVGLGLRKIPVTDLERSVPFYATLLGAEPAFVAEAYGWVQFVECSDLDGNELKIMEVAAR
jgi:predicted enzyme related to lactoylglutathione lyase